MPITDPEWESIYRAIEQGRVAHELVEGYVIERDPVKGTIRVAEFGDQDVPVVGFPSNLTYYRGSEKRDARATLVVPEIGDLVLCARPGGSSRVPRCLGISKAGKAWKQPADLVSAAGGEAGPHNHDDRYYTETETDTLLAGKAPAVHTHDDRYYTETEMDIALASKAALVHTHDDRYYTKTEIDSKITALEALVSATVATPTNLLTLRDNFNRANGAVGSNWTTLTGTGLLIESNQLKGPGSWSGAAWNVALPGPHECRFTLTVEPTVDNDYHYFYLLDSLTLASANGYALEFDNDYWDLFRIDAGTFVRLNAWSAVHDTGYFQNGDAVSLALRGNDVVCYRRRGGHWQEMGRKTDATYRPANMYRGVEFAPGTTVRMDDFCG